MKKEEQRRRFEELFHRLITEPDAVREEQNANLVEGYGQEWFEANRELLYLEWYEIATRIFGFPSTLRDD